MGTPTVAGVNNAAGQNAGTTSTTNVSITLTAPAGVANGDRVFVVQCGTAQAGTTPAGVTDLSKNVQIGTGTVAAGSGLRWISVYYFTYTTGMTMPSFVLTSTLNNSHWIGAIAVRPSSPNFALNTPTISPKGEYFGTAGTAYRAVWTGASFTVHANALQMVGTVCNDNVTSSVSSFYMPNPASSWGGTERCDGGTATGNDVSGRLNTVSVTLGNAGADTAQAHTLSAASQGGSLLFEQTETRIVPALSDPQFLGVGTPSGAGNAGTATTSVSPTLAPDTASGDRVFVYHSSTVPTTTTYTGWTPLFTNTQIGTGAVASGSGLRYLSVFYRDYDGVWTIPAFTTPSAAAPSAGAVAATLFKNPSDSWNTPTYSSPGDDYGTANTSLSNVVSLTTRSLAVLMFSTTYNDLVTMSAPGLSGGSTANFASQTAGIYTGTPGNLVRGFLFTADVVTGASNTFTLTATTAQASEAGTIVVQQHAELPAGPLFSTVTDDFSGTLANWEGGPNNFSIVSGALKLTANNTDGLIGMGPGNIVGSAIYWQQTNLALTGDDYMKAAVYDWDSGSGGWGFYFTASSVQALVNNTPTGPTRTHTNGDFYRIREASGTLFYEYSTNPAASWTTLHSAAAAPPRPDRMEFTYFVNHQTGTCAATIDKFNITPPPVAVGPMGDVVEDWETSYTPADVPFDVNPTVWADPVLLGGGSVEIQDAATFNANFGSTVATTGQALELAVVDLGAIGFALQATTNYYEFTDTAISCEIHATTSAFTNCDFVSTGQATIFQLSIWDSGLGPAFYIARQAGTVDLVTDFTTVTYDPVAHRHLRLREASGTIYWETSPDRTTWTVIDSTSTSGYFPGGENAVMYPYWQLFDFDGAGGDQYMMVDNINVAPGGNTGAFFFMG